MWGMALQRPLQVWSSALRTMPAKVVDHKLGKPNAKSSITSRVPSNLAERLSQAKFAYTIVFDVMLIVFAQCTWDAVQ